MNVIVEDIETKKKISVYVLKCFDDFCKKNDIKYFIYYGTLLGAVRHKGYIPWDDDIDIAMTWDNYKKLLSLSNNMPKGFILHNSFNTKDYMNLYGSGFCTNSTGVNSQYGIGVGIFPLTKCVNNKLVYHIERIIIRNLAIISYGKNMYNYENDTFFKKLVKKIINKIFYFVSFKKLSYLYNKTVDLVENSNLKFECLAYINEIKCNKIPKSCFDEYIELDYENNKFLAPGKYDEILKMIYGNYMEFPPVSERCYCHDHVPTEIEEETYNDAINFIKRNYNEK